MKQVTVAGRLGKDAVLRTTQGGDSVLGFSVAVDDRRGQEKQTLWFDCSIWGRRGEALSQYLTKGTSVAVSGDLGTREHDGRTYLTVRVDQVTLLGGNRDGATSQRQQQSNGMSGAHRASYDAQAPQSKYGGRAPYDDDIPF